VGDAGSLRPRASLIARADYRELSYIVIPARIRVVCRGLLSVALVASSLFAVGETLRPAPAAAQTTFTFEGGGWGHAVGMSQWGAKGRADAGQTVAQIIGAYYSGTQITPIPTAPPTVRVHLADTASTTVAFTAPSTVTGNSGTLASILAGETVEVKAVGAAFQLQVTAPTPKAAVSLAANEVVVMPLGGSPARLSATGNRYNNGRLVIRLAGSGTLEVVNDSLTMQQYLYGLAEVPSSWPVEALKAQALAGRTYAYKRVLSPRTSTYDILSTTTDQVYAGYEKEGGALGSQWVAAVNGTDQQIITYNGSAIDALYSSSNGGFSEDSGYAFVTSLPYLRAAADPFDNAAGNTNFRWTRSYSGTELSQYLTAYRSVNIGTITNYEITGSLSTVGRIDRANVKLIGTSGSHTLTGAQLRNMINQSAPSNRQLQSTLLFLRPIGSLDAASPVPGLVILTGWTFYRGGTAPAIVHVYVNDQFAASGVANLSRPDVAVNLPGSPSNSGFSMGVAVDRAVNTICAYGLTPNGSGSTLLGCRGVTVDTQPFGSLDVAVPTPGGVRVSGWAADPNTAGSTDVHVYVNGQMAGTTPAANQRGDIAAVFPAYGAARGFAATFPVDQAVNTVCAYGINVGPGSHVLLGCRTVVNSVQPFGSLDFVSGNVDGVHVGGWAIDPDTSDPIDLHVYVDGVGRAALTANLNRSDVAAAVPGYGSAHGFAASITASPGLHSVCVFAINVRAGSHQLLGCRNAFVVADPFGSVDVVRATPEGIRVSGWAIDPNTNEPIDVHAYVGTRGWVTTADKDRPDLAAAYPTAGTKRGFEIVVPGQAGQVVCVYAINAGPGATQTVACRAATG
jgi:SpoIID/LytB domain protein